jgi:hypothetical protein
MTTPLSPRKSPTKATQRSSKRLRWFDDPPSKRMRTEERPERPRVRPLAEALPKPARIRLTPPRPAKVPDLGTGVSRARIDPARIRLPRRVPLLSAAMLPKMKARSVFAPR